MSNRFVWYTRDVSRFRDSRLTYHVGFLNGKDTRVHVACSRQENVRDAIGIGYDGIGPKLRDTRDRD